MRWIVYHVRFEGEYAGDDIICCIKQILSKFEISTVRLWLLE